MRGKPYGTEADLLGKLELEKLFEDQKDITITILGSPDAREFTIVSDDIKKEINIITYDFNTESHTDDHYKNSFKSFKLIEGDIFEQKFETNSDFVFSRWFIHHCTTKQKESIIQTSYNILKPNGKLILIDWFIPDWNTSGEFIKACERYYKYHEEFNLAPSKIRQQLRMKENETPNGKGGKFYSMNKMEKLLEENKLIIENKLLLAPENSDKELFGQAMYICRK